MASWGLPLPLGALPQGWLAAPVHGHVEPVGLVMLLVVLLALDVVQPASRYWRGKFEPPDFDVVTGLAPALAV